MADLELFRRALPGTRAYFPVLLVTLLGMHFPWDYPWLFCSFAPAFLLAGLSRYLLLGRAVRNYTHNPNLWRGRFRRTILLTPLVWGAFGATVVLLYGLHWDVAFCIVVSAGQGSGAAASLHPDLRLRRAYPLTLYLPMIAALLYTGLPGLALAVLSCVFMVYLIKLGDEMGRRYWNHLSDRLFVEQLSQLTLALVGNLSQEEVLTRLSDHLECLLEFSSSRALGPDGEVLLEKIYAAGPAPEELSVNLSNGLRFSISRSEPFSADDQQVLSTFCHPAATALERTRLFSEIGRMALFDELTRIANRRHFLQKAAELLQTTNRLDQKSGLRTPISIILFDVDHFKHVNDTYGHDVGDLVLKEIARRCQQALREVDLLARYGGEEFAGLLPGATQAEALRVADERLRRCIADQPFEAPQGPLKVTISLGVAEYRDDLNQTLKLADEALYRCKADGRNCARPAPSK
jgi:diguanylate cyclase (GGDEF)-like protein